MKPIPSLPPAVSPFTHSFRAAGVAALFFLSVATRIPAAIVFHPIADPPFVAGFPNYLTQEIDIDGDGIVDASVGADLPPAGGGLGALLFAPPGHSGVFGVDYPPPSNDLGFLTIALNFGEEIGPMLTTDYGPLAGFYSDDAFGGGGLLVGTDGWAGHYWGDFAAMPRAYAGLRFESDGEQHYAWVDLQVWAIGNGATLLVHGWAYETEPDKPIAAGAVPEPNTALLFLGGGAAIFLRRRTHNKASKSA
ncbi:MAG: PEP-CTERM sorting domain-containing protein [Chthoniobacteraceae bacterium]